MHVRVYNLTNITQHFIQFIHQKKIYNEKVKIQKINTEIPSILLSLTKYVKKIMNITYITIYNQKKYDIHT